MNNSRRIGAVVAAAAAAMGMATVGLASPAAASERGPQPASTWLRAVRAHTGTWVNIAWTTDRRICDAEVRVDGGRRIDIGYPGHRRFASFTRSDTLRPGRVDYTRVFVNPDFDRTGVAVLRASIRFDDCGGRAHSQVRSQFLTLPVVRSNWHPGGGQQGQRDNNRGNDNRGNDNNRGNNDNNRGNNDTRGNNNHYTPGTVAPTHTTPVTSAPTHTTPTHTTPTHTAPTHTTPATTAPTATVSPTHTRPGGYPGATRTTTVY